MFLLCLNPIAATDFWWQLATGEWILAHRAIPTHDPFSWTAAGQRWIAHEWLTEVLFALTWKWLPHPAFLLYKCGLGVLACGIAAVHARARGASHALALVVAILAAWVVRNYADLRPQMLTYVFLTLLLLGLDRFRAGGLRRLPVWLPCGFALWANLHGGVVLGMVVFGAWLAGEWLGALLFGEEARHAQPLSWSFGACLVATLLNPAGAYLYDYPRVVLSHPQVMDYITEWLTPDFHRPYLRPFLVILVATFGLRAVTCPPPGERRCGEWATLSMLAISALTVQRNTAVFAIAAVPALAEGATALLHQARTRLPATSAALFHRLTPWITALLLSFSIRQALPPGPPGAWFDYGVGMGSFPRQAAERLARGEWPGRLYNDYVWGGYLLWRLQPARRVFVDGRAEVYYAGGAFADEMVIHRVAAGWQEALDRRGVEVVVTSREDGLAAALARSPVWSEAFRGTVESVFVRSETQGKK